jgi:hypothetical protein
VGDHVAKDSASQRGVAAPAGWQDWRRWVDGVDWSDWRAWLQRVASTDWAAGQWASAPWEQSARAGQIPLTLRAFAEDEPGDQIGDHVAAAWPAFRRWWRDGANTRPAPGQARARLEEHMPELVPAWQRLTAMIGSGADGDAGPALALWNPPPFLTGCSQAVVPGGGPALIRNYDFPSRSPSRWPTSTAKPCAGTGRRTGNCWPSRCSRSKPASGSGTRQPRPGQMTPAR